MKISLSSQRRWETKIKKEKENNKKTKRNVNVMISERERKKYVRMSFGQNFSPILTFSKNYKYSGPDADL
jgi:hypothetical protein